MSLFDDIKQGLETAISMEKEKRMYNKKYILEKIEEFNKPNPIYEGMEGCVCMPAYLKPGERGWVLYIRDDWFDPTPHRLHTSIIQDVEYGDDHIIVKTQNTRFTFRVEGTER